MFGSVSLCVRWATRQNRAVDAGTYSPEGSPRALASRSMGHPTCTTVPLPGALLLFTQQQVQHPRQPPVVERQRPQPIDEAARLHDDLLKIPHPLLELARAPSVSHACKSGVSFNPGGKNYRAESVKTPMSPRNRWPIIALIIANRRVSCLKDRGIK
jgi:hypothetical protein